MSDTCEQRKRPRMLCWPPQCCVPAFVYAALLSEDIEPIEPQFLARMIGVRVGPGDANPYGLPIASKKKEFGVTAGDAKIAIGRLLDMHANHLGFRHIPFSTIQFELYPDVLREALESKCYVGAGVDPSRLPIPALQGLRHVVRLAALDGVRIQFIDDCSQTPSLIEIDWDTLERAILAVDDGFWVIGRKECLAFKNSLPISGVTSL